MMSLTDPDSKLGYKPDLAEIIEKIKFTDKTDKGTSSDNQKDAKGKAKAKAKAKVKAKAKGAGGALDKLRSQLASLRENGEDEEIEEDGEEDE